MMTPHGIIGWERVESGEFQSTQTLGRLSQRKVL